MFCFIGGFHEDWRRSRPLVVTCVRPGGPADRWGHGSAALCVLAVHEWAHSNYCMCACMHVFIVCVFRCMAQRICVLVIASSLSAIKIFVYHLRRIMIDCKPTISLCTHYFFCISLCSGCCNRICGCDTYFVCYLQSRKGTAHPEANATLHFSPWKLRAP